MKPVMNDRLGSQGVGHGAGRSGWILLLTLFSARLAACSGGDGPPVDPARQDGGRAGPVAVALFFEIEEKVLLDCARKRSLPRDTEVIVDLPDLYCWREMRDPGMSSRPVDGYCWGLPGAVPPPGVRLVPEGKLRSEDVLRRRECAEEARKRREQERRRQREAWLASAEPLPELPRPVATMPVPKVKVRDLGLKPSPVPGVIHDVFVGDDGRPKVFVTEKAIFFMRPDGKVKKKIARKSDPRKNVETASVGSSDDGRWIWQVYVPAEHAEDRLYYEYVKTDIYDGDGRPWWTVPGASIESISPSGKRAVAILPENSGMMLYEKDSKVEKMVEDRGTAQSWACAFDDGYVYVSSKDLGSEISVFDAAFEKREVGRYRGHCMLDGCLPSVNRVLIDCSAPWDGVTMLLMLDSKGREITRTWLPTVGERLVSLDKKRGRVLFSMSFGESLYLDLKGGEVLGFSSKLEGFPEYVVPRKEFVGTRKQYNELLNQYHREWQNKYLVERVVQIDGAIARVRKLLRSNKVLFEVTDLAGSIIATKQGEIDELPRYLPIRLPVLWNEGKTARALFGGKVQVLEVVPEVAP